MKKLRFVKNDLMIFVKIQMRVGRCKIFFEKTPSSSPKNMAIIRIIVIIKLQASMFIYFTHTIDRLYLHSKKKRD
jgi:hypothetical protein